MESVLNAFYEEILPEQDNGSVAVFACTDAEPHRVGLRMVADVFEMHGWATYFLGLGLPVEDLIPFVAAKKPHALGLSVSVMDNYERFIDTLERIRHAFPDLPVLVGGQALTRGHDHTRFSKLQNITYLKTLHEVQAYIGGSTPDKAISAN